MILDERIVFTKYSAVLESAQSRLKISFTIKAYTFVCVHASFPANLCTFFKVAALRGKKIQIMENRKNATGAASCKIWC